MNTWRGLAGELKLVGTHGDIRCDIKYEPRCSEQGQGLVAFVLSYTCKFGKNLNVYRRDTRHRHLPKYMSERIIQSRRRSFNTQSSSGSHFIYATSLVVLTNMDRFVVGILNMF